MKGLDLAAAGDRQRYNPILRQLIATLSAIPEFSNSHSPQFRATPRFSPTRSFDWSQDRFIPSVAPDEMIPQLDYSHALGIKRYTLSERRGMWRVRKKLREARFFLGKMADRAQMAFGEHEESDFYLSAFLSAGRSVDYRLRHEQGATYSTFRVSWDNALSPDKQRLMKFMVDDRNDEVHESGSNRAELENRIPVYRSYEDKSGKATVFAVPGTPPAVIIKPTYSFTVDGQQVPVLEACRTYIDLLDRLVVDYCQSQGIA